MNIYNVSRNGVWLRQIIAYNYNEALRVATGLYGFRNVSVSFSHKLGE